MENLLQGLDDIEWEKLSHAYGSAADVPNNLRILLSEDKEKRDQALTNLFISVTHQGTIYEATLFVLPFVLELMKVSFLKEDMIVWFAIIAGGQSYHEAHLQYYKEGTKEYEKALREFEKEYVWVSAIRKSISPHVEFLQEHINHDMDFLREIIALALGFYPEYKDSSLKLLNLRLNVEDEEQVIRSIVQSIKRLTAEE